MRPLRKSSESYVSVTATLVLRSRNAVLLDLDGREVWIPRSLIFGPDETSLDRVALDSEVTLDVMEWKAKQEGLV